MDVEEKQVPATSVETFEISPVVEEETSTTVITAAPIFLDPVITKEADHHLSLKHNAAP